MNTSYNTQEDFASSIKNFFINIGITRKTWLNIMPYIIFGMILAESVVTSDIAKKLKDKFFLFNIILSVEELIASLNRKLLIFMLSLT